MTGKSLGAKAAAHHIGVSRRTFYNMLKTDRFPVEPIPGTKPRRWYVESLDAWLRGESA
jgi:predicted DNA-binding transcriptional regulator AlpA